jgi:hypothetical protein
MIKPQLPSQALRTEVEQRLRLVPILRVALEQDAAFEVCIGSPRLHARDGRGRNWNISGFRSGFVFWPQCQEEFRDIVDRLRERFDLG